MSRHAGLFFALWALWLALGSLALGPNSYVRVLDEGNGHVPARIAASMDGTSLALTRWAPWCAGVDRFAQAMNTDLSVVLFALLPSWLAYGSALFLQRWVAGYFSWRLFQDQLKLGLGPSLYGAMAYSLFAQGALAESWNGFELALGLSLPGLPLALWLVGRLNVRTVWPAVVTVSALGVFISLTSPLVFTVYLAPFVLAWFLFIVPRREPRFWMLPAVLFFAWSLSSAPFLSAMLANAPDSQRAAWTGSAGLNWHGRTAFALGMLLDNLPALAPAAWAFWRRSARRQLVALAGIIALCCFFLVAYAFIQPLIHAHLSRLSGVQLDRFYLMVPLAAIVAGAIGLEQIARTDGIRKQKAVATLVIALLCLQSLATKVRALDAVVEGSNYKALYGNDDVLKLARDHRGDAPFRVASVAADGLHPAYAWAYGLETADGYVNLYPLRYQMYWSAVLAPLKQEDAAALERFLSWGNRVYLFVPRRDPASAEPVVFDRYFNRNLLSLENVRYVLSPKPLDAPTMSLLASNVRESQLAWQKLSFTKKVLAMVRGDYPGTPIYVYENHDALPRFFLAGQVRWSDTEEKVLREMQAADLETLRSAAFLSRGDVADQAPAVLGGGQGDVRVQRYAADRIELEVHAETACVLVITNNYSAGWHAAVDKVPARILPADYAFQGILVPAGNHSVTLEYSARSMPAFSR